MSEVPAGPITAQPADAAPVQTTEAPKTETPKAENDFLAPKFAALTRKEKEIRAKEAAIKAREAEVTKMREEWEQRTKSAQSTEAQLLQDLKQNPLKFMEKHGLTFEQLTEMQLNEQNPTPQMLIQQIRAELKAEMEDKYGKLTETLKEKEQREAQERYDAAVTSYKTEISDFVKSNADTFELIVANNATDLVFETAEEYYQQTGKVPDVQDVAKAVEEHLEEQAKQIFKLKKFQTAPKTEATTEPPKGSQTAPTLSNTLSAEVPKSGAKQLSAEQSKKEAAKLLRWNS